MYQMLGKRGLDVSMAVLVMLIFSWLIVLIVIIYSITFQFPILYRSIRIGRNGKLFTFWKFRTLSVDTNKSLDERRFFIGNLLRFTNLDELPQLWNVLKGEMSIVGPRPLPIEYLPLFSKQQLVRHDVLPGITGWAQVNGRHSIAWQQKFELDIYYVNRVSFRLDMLILFKTVVLLISFRKDKSLAEEKFKGN